MPQDYKLIRRLQTFENAIHRDLAQTQIKHVTNEYTEERVASLMAKVEAARRYWDWHEFKVNV